MDHDREPLELAAVLERAARPQRFVLVDCITLWISNVMARGRPVSEEIEGLCRVMAAASGDVCLVSNEVGLGIVPDNPLARRFPRRGWACASAACGGLPACGVHGGGPAHHGQMTRGPWRVGGRP
jgi:adenosyl cobinamide kinase/adenosyl cobinamide phosphate guanylyltransferase